MDFNVAAPCANCKHESTRFLENQVRPWQTGPMSSSISAVLSERLSTRGGKAGLAKALGVAASTVGRWTDGTSSPHRDQWAAIEDYLKLEPGSLGGEASDVLKRLTAVESELQELRGRVSVLVELLQPDRERR